MCIGKYNCGTAILMSKEKEQGQFLLTVRNDLAFPYSDISLKKELQLFVVLK